MKSRVFYAKLPLIPHSHIFGIASIKQVQQKRQQWKNKNTKTFQDTPFFKNLLLIS